MSGERAKIASVLLVGMLSITAVRLTSAGETVPLTKEGGTLIVPVIINDSMKLGFTIDTGASDVSIPFDVYSTLRRTGTILPSDLLDIQVYALADGSEHRSQRFRIRSLKVGNSVITDVTGSVAPPSGPLLLGQSFLSRLHTWSIDNQRQLLLIDGASPASAPEKVAALTYTSSGKSADGTKEIYVDPSSIVVSHDLEQHGSKLSLRRTLKEVLPEIRRNGSATMSGTAPSIATNKLCTLTRALFTMTTERNPMTIARPSGCSQTHLIIHKRRLQTTH